MIRSEFIFVQVDSNGDIHVSMEDIRSDDGLFVLFNFLRICLNCPHLKLLNNYENMIFISFINRGVI